jgi:hypothetical protein
MKAPPRRWFPPLILMLVLTAAAAATPIQPDLQKLLSKPHSAQESFEPARAGWEGPETEFPALVRTSFALDRFGPAEAHRVARESFLAAAVPDLRVWACLGVVIVLLRKRKRTTPKPFKASESNTVEVGRAA